jgi:hypothetical protein
MKLVLDVAVAVALAMPALAAEVGIRPDLNKTGGSVRPGPYGHDPELVCNATGTRGPMPKARSDEVLTRYRLPPGSHPDYEIDHLVPLCLGGADDASNLWPQPRRSIEPNWNAEAKDRLERTLCALVCDKLLDIGDAQEAIIKDWIAAYHLYNE